MLLHQDQVQVQRPIADPYLLHQAVAEALLHIQFLQEVVLREVQAHMAVEAAAVAAAALALEVAAVVVVKSISKKDRLQAIT